jgi:hypothetical protein
MTTGLIAVLLILCADAPANDFKPHTFQEQQDQAVSEIQKLGGSVRYDFQRDPNFPDSFNLDAQPKEPGQARWVVFVRLRGTKVKDDDLKHLKKLPFLENVDLSNTQISSSGMVHLRNSKHLACLCLWNTKVGDAGLKHLQDCKKLSTLLLDGTRITDAGLAHLEGLPSLQERLGLADTAVTDEGLKHLERLVALRNLNLLRTSVSKAGLQRLGATLRDTNISPVP